MERQQGQYGNHPSTHTSTYKKRKLKRVLSLIAIIIIALTLFSAAALLFPKPANTWPIIATNYPITTADNQSISYASYCSEALDNNGNPHLSYYASFDACLKYACWNGTSWYIQTVDAATIPLGASGSWGVGLFSSLALDSKGYPHICYHSYTDFNTRSNVYNASLAHGELKYASWDGVTWKTQTIDTGLVGEYCSIALDSSDNPHISYYAENTHDQKYDGNLKYASWTGTLWNIETVDSVDDVGYCTSLALDSSDQPNISYLDSANGNLKYANYANKEWHIQVVDHYSQYTFNGGGHLAGPQTSLALDSSGNPNIGYISDKPNGETGQDLRYARWNGTDWSIKIVDTGNSTSNSLCSLALDSYDYPHFAYVALINSYQKNSYTAWKGSAWNTVTFERNYDPITGGSVALDSADKPHIIASDSLLKYYYLD